MEKSLKDRVRDYNKSVRKCRQKKGLKLYIPVRVAKYGPDQHITKFYIFGILFGKLKIFIRVISDFKSILTYVSGTDV